MATIKTPSERITEALTQAAEKRGTKTKPKYRGVEVNGTEGLYAAIMVIAVILDELAKKK